MPEIAERWLPVVGWEGSYEVSNFGRVRSMDRFIDRRVHPYWAKGQLLKPGLGSGRPTVGLYKNSVVHRVQIGILVAEAFIGPRPDGMECCHRNDDCFNNHVDNLRWDTPRANKLDLVRNGRHSFARRSCCKYGHEYTPENTRLRVRNRSTSRVCLACERRRKRKMANGDSAAANPDPVSTNGIGALHVA